MVSSSDEVSDKRPLENGCVPKYKTRKVSAIRDFPPGCGPNAVPKNSEENNGSESSNGEAISVKNSEMTDDVVAVSVESEAIENSKMVKTEADGVKTVEVKPNSEIQNVVDVHMTESLDALVDKVAHETTVSNPIEIEKSGSLDSMVGEVMTTPISGYDVDQLETGTEPIGISKMDDMIIVADSSSEDTEVGGQVVLNELNAASPSSSSIRPKDKYRRRRVSAVRDFPPNCGRNVPLPTEEAKQMVFSRDGLLDKVDPEQPGGGGMGEDALDDDAGTGQLGEKKKVNGEGMIINLEESNIEKTEVGQAVPQSQSPLKIDDTGEPVRKDIVVYSQDTNVSSGNELPKEIVHGLMAAPHCPWRKGKVAFKKSGGRTNVRQQNLSRSEAVAMDSNLENDSVACNGQVHQITPISMYRPLENSDDDLGKEVVVYSPGENNENEPSQSAFTSEDEADREVVHGLMSAPNCPWKKEKKDLSNSNGGGMSRENKSEKVPSWRQKSKAVAKKSSGRASGLSSKKHKKNVEGSPDTLICTDDEDLPLSASKKSSGLSSKKHKKNVVDSPDTFMRIDDEDLPPSTSKKSAGLSSKKHKKNGVDSTDTSMRVDDEDLLPSASKKTSGLSSKKHKKNVGDSPDTFMRIDDEDLPPSTSKKSAGLSSKKHKKNVVDSPDTFMRVDDEDLPPSASKKSSGLSSKKHKKKVVDSPDTFKRTDDKYLPPSASKKSSGLSSKKHKKNVKDSPDTFMRTDDKDLPPSASTTKKQEFEVILPPFGPNISDHSDARNRVKDTLRVFHSTYRKLLQQEESDRTPDIRKLNRLDLLSAKIVKDKGKEVNTGIQILGQVPGVEVGDEFQYRVELAVVGIHRLYQAGIDWLKLDGVPVATSIVASGGYPDDMENADVLIYSGQGGNVLKKGKDPEDQKLERGNLALSNSISAQTPVRVVRGWKTKLVDPLEPKAKMVTTYVYDGLYRVKDCQTAEGPRGNHKVFKFELRRIPGQPELAWKQLKKAKIRPGVCVDDISGGEERLPICAVNTHGDEKPPQFTYTAKMIYPDWYKPIPPAGCDCTGRCSGSKKCRCAARNGGEIPYNHNGAIVEPKALVYECGPHCRCPPSCYNRVTQRGIRFQLEIFKTESRGWGVRAVTSIPSGSFICEYAGELLEDKEAEQRVGFDEYLFDIGQNYIDSSVKPEDQALSAELMEEGGYTIDAGKFGSIGRFINHSCLPNLYAQNVIYDHDDRKMPHVMFFATENIPPLQELTYHYNYSVDQIRDADGNIKVKKCYCGTAECTGRMY